MKGNIEYTILIVTVLLLVISLFSMYSATYDAGASDYFRRHVFWMLIGLLLMVSVALVPFRTLQLFSYPMYGLSILLLIGVLVFGKAVAGSRSWFGVGTLGMQPAEFAKVGTILALSSYLWQRHVSVRQFKHIVVALVIVAVPAALVIMQPDIGTSLIFLAIVVPMFYWAGASSFFMLGITAPVVSAIAALFGTTPFVLVVFLTLVTLLLMRVNRLVSALVFSVTVLIGVSVQYIYNNLQPYQQNRIDTFLDPESDPQGGGYNVIQSTIAIGSGGIFGKGYLEGTQTQLNFIPAQWTDFIFCVTGEEFGFVGAFVVLSLFAVFLLRGVQIATTVKSPYASMLAIGIVSIVAVHIIINIGMSMGLLPVIGIPLPFFSYGGSHLITSLIMVGLLLNLYLNRKEY